jgi:hypothetical protein
MQRQYVAFERPSGTPVVLATTVEGVVGLLGRIVVGGLGAVPGVIARNATRGRTAVVEWTMRRIGSDLRGRQT